MRRRKINQLEVDRRFYMYSSRKLKSRILDSYCEAHGYNRKYAIRKLGRYSISSSKRPGPSVKYAPEKLLKPLRRIWFDTDQMCGKRLVAALPLWLPYYSKKYEPLSAEVENLLLSISAATVDRMLKDTKKITARRRRCATKPGTLLKNKIAIKTSNWDVTEPGYMEADSVAHCGNSLQGDFVWSITLTDIYSEWTEIRAAWNKGAFGILTGIEDIESKLPFKIKGFDSDNGSEFLNHHLYQYFNERNEKVVFTRSRPYKKNDNAHVEQKNWTHVRQLMGYGRFGDSGLVELMNDLYRCEWSLLNNYFCPSMKLIKKIKVGSKYRNTYDEPQTPYQRLLKSGKIGEKKKAELRAIFKTLDPYSLRQSIEAKLAVIMARVTPALKPKNKV